MAKQSFSTTHATRQFIVSLASVPKTSLVGEDKDTLSIKVRTLLGVKELQVKDGDTVSVNDSLAQYLLDNYRVPSINITVNGNKLQEQGEDNDIFILLDTVDEVETTSKEI